MFIALYARFMSGEKAKDEFSEMTLGPCDGAATPNNEVQFVISFLETWFDQNARSERAVHTDGWLEFLYGLALARAKLEILAKSWLVKSLNLYPYNWGAWLELAALLGSVDEVCIPAFDTRAFQLTGLSFSNTSCTRLLSYCPETS